MGPGLWDVPVMGLSMLLRLKITESSDSGEWDFFLVVEIRFGFFFKTGTLPHGKTGSGISDLL